MLALLTLLACSSTPEPAANEAPADAAVAVAENPSGAKETRKSAKTSKVTNITVADLKALSDVYIVDVRTPQEFKQAHVPGAVNISIETLLASSDQLSDKRGEDVYFICHSGARSARVADKLAADGFTAFNVSGGTKAWIAAGYPTE